MMLIDALRLNVQIAPGCIRKRFKKMVKHFCGHLANFFTLEIGIPNQPVAAAKINSSLCQAIVHRQAKAVALNAALVA